MGRTPKNNQAFLERFFHIPGTADSMGVGLGFTTRREMVFRTEGASPRQSARGTGSEFYFDLPTTGNGVKA
jgi:signal transduction histidine kinase